jgi:hypothetical protein
MDSAEKTTIEAEFVRLDEAAVVIKKDGKEIAVPLAKLSLNSHLQALKLAKPEAYSKPAPKIIVGLPPTAESEKLLVSPFPANPTIEQFLDTVIAEFEAKNTMVLWHALTPEMQTDVEDIISSSIEAGGSGFLVQVRSLMKQLGTLMTEKQQFFLASPAIAGKPEMQQQITALGAFTSALAEKQVWDSENFKPGKVAPWLAAVNEKAGPSSFTLLFERPFTQMFPGVSMRDTKKALAYKVVSQEGDNAEVQFLNPALSPMVADPQTGQRRPSKDGRKLAFVRVADKWLPKSMVDTWSAGVLEAKSDLAQAMPLARTALAGVIPVVSSLNNARTPQEFNLAVQQIGGLMGGNAQAGGYASGGGAYPAGGYPAAMGSGAMGSGAMDSGMMLDSGGMNSGAMNSGGANSGAMDSSMMLNSGGANSGGANSGGMASPGMPLMTTPM